MVSYIREFHEKFVEKRSTSSMTNASSIVVDTYDWMVSSSSSSSSSSSASISSASSCVEEKENPSIVGSVAMIPNSNSRRK